MALRSDSVAVALLLLLGLAAFAVRGGSEETSSHQMTINLPDVNVESLSHNDYICTSAKLPSEDNYIVQFEPRADPRLVHHMLLFGCPSVSRRKHTWSCMGSNVCDEPSILFAWALNASGLQLPKDVGMVVGPSNDLRYAVLQIHYGEPEALTDVEINPEALVLHFSRERQKYVAGIYLLGSGSSISPGKEAANVDTACRFRGPKSIFPFAFRSHAHGLGLVVAGFVVKQGSNEWKMIGSRSPQDAQAFYPANHVTVNPGDWLASRCIYNTTEKTHAVAMGAKSEDEMCNFYIMYYTENDDRSLTEDDCWSPAPRSFHYPEIEIPKRSSSAHHHSHHMHGTEDEEDDETSDLPSLEDLFDGDSLGSEHEGNKNEEEEMEEEYICPKPVSPGPPSSCIKPESPLTATSSPSTRPPALTLTTSSPSTPSLTSAITTPTGSDTMPFFEGGDENSPSGVATDELVLAEDWPFNRISSPRIGDVTLGQVTAVAVDKEGHVHVLHRGPREWEYGSFSSRHIFNYITDGPIAVPTLVKLTSTGQPLSTWGSDFFYLPHGLTIDSRGNFWITDVAMHQVFKFGEGDSSPSLVLGNEFRPGRGKYGFCQPAAVAVEDSGVFYVADGYCNQRVMKFDASGDFLEMWTQSVEEVPLYIPHSLALSPNQKELFVADRENGRILVYQTDSGTGRVFSDSEDDFMGNVYAIAFNHTNSWPLYAVNGPADTVEISQGLSVQEDGAVFTSWGPEEGFSAPHWLATDPSSNAVYVAEIRPNRIWKYIPMISHVGHEPLDSSSLAPSTEPASEQLPTESTTVSSPDDSSPSISAESDSTPLSAVTPPVSTDETTVTQPSTAGFAPSGNTTVSATAGKLPDKPISATEIPNTDDSTPDETSDSPITQAPDETSDSPITQVTAAGTHKRAKSAYPFVMSISLFSMTLAIIIAVVCILRGTCKSTYYSLYRNKASKGKGKDPKKALHSLLGPSQRGFSRLRTYDSDSEADEFPIFSRV